MMTKRTRRVGQGALRRKTAQEEAIFFTHSWKMHRVHNSNLGEPVYIQVCEDCGLIPSEAWDNPCTKGNDDERSTGPVP